MLSAAWKVKNVTDFTSKKFLSFIEKSILKCRTGIREKIYISKTFNVNSIRKSFKLEIPNKFEHEYSNT